ncbi:MAG: DUF1194 domain-containing protein [Alphaproteobacteria bacterium]|nr:DUF1194 domain-containing protein [Alphaproteobacteria bacterium]
MPNGGKTWGKRLLCAVFGAAAGVMTLGAPSMAQDGHPSHDTAQYAPIAAPTNMAAYRHPTLASQSDEDVGVLLVLAMDASGSMSNEEWRIQVEATAAALLSTQVRSTIRCKSGDASVAISVVDFSDQPNIRIPWVDLRPRSCTGPDPEFDHKLELLATEIARLERSSSGSTHIGNMLQYTLQMYVNAPWKPTERRVLDVSGDGDNNGGVAMEPGRQALMDYGVTINGIAIVNDDPDLENTFRENLVSNEFRRSPDRRSASTQGHVWVVAENLRSTGNGAMVLYTLSQRVESALTQKISMEVAGIYDQNQLNQVIQQASVVPFVPPAPQEPERRTAEVRQVAALPRVYAMK